MDFRWLLVGIPVTEFLMEGLRGAAGPGRQERAGDPLAPPERWPICEGSAGERVGYPWERVAPPAPAAHPLSALLARARHLLLPAGSAR
jgi:hypothetical protein